MLDIKRNLTTMTDFYELTMSAGYFDEGYKDKIAVFDMFFRRVPDGGGYAIMAGLQQFIDAVDHLQFTPEDIDYLRSTRMFREDFLEYLANFQLHCNIWAIEEGVPIFPQEPIVTVEGPAIECQLLETLLLGFPTLLKENLGNTSFSWVMLLNTFIGILVAYFQKTGAIQGFSQWSMTSTSAAEGPSWRPGCWGCSFISATPSAPCLWAAPCAASRTRPGSPGRSWPTSPTPPPRR